VLQVPEQSVPQQRRVAFYDPTFSATKGLLGESTRGEHPGKPAPGAHPSWVQQLQDHRQPPSCDLRNRSWSVELKERLRVGWQENSSDVPHKVDKCACSSAFVLHVKRFWLLQPFLFSWLIYIFISHVAVCSSHLDVTIRSRSLK